MTEQNLPQSIAESISALVDSQASELELLRVLKASEQDIEVKALWARYQRVGAVLRGESVWQGAGVSSDFSSRIAAAIAAEEPVVVAPRGKPQQGMWYQLGRVALVASVAGGMIFSVQQYNDAPRGVEVAATNNAGPSVPAANALSFPAGINAPGINTRSVALQTGYENRPQENRRVLFQPLEAVSANTSANAVSEEEVTRYVNQMIQAHSDNAALNSGQGVLPYARVIITDEE